jgi:serine/threonine protein kinase
LEYVDGGSLAQKVNGTPQLPRYAAQLVETLARAVGAAHQRGIIHRDLKPANVLLTAGGDPKITDFGLAKLVEGGAGLTQSGVIVGTPSYMAPEQAKGKTKAIGPVTDVYGLGAILYELLTGRPPFRAVTPSETVQQVLSEQLVPPTRLQRKIPRDLETICLKCLEKNGTRRYASAEELAKDLRSFSRRRPDSRAPTEYSHPGLVLGSPTGKNARRRRHPHLREPIKSSFRDLGYFSICKRGPFLGRWKRYGKTLDGILWVCRRIHCIGDLSSHLRPAPLCLP